MAVGGRSASASDVMIHGRQRWKKLSDIKRDHAVEKHLAVSRRAAGLLAFGNNVLMAHSRRSCPGLSGPHSLWTSISTNHRTSLHQKSEAGLREHGGSYLSTALEAAMPYGSDRTLLHFLMDRAVKTGSRFVSWKTATEFLSTMNLATAGKNRRDLRERFRRIAGLTIGVERKTADSYSGRVMPVIGECHLSTSIDLRAETNGSPTLPLTDKII